MTEQVQETDSFLETIEAGARKLFGEFAEEVTEQLSGEIIQAGIAALKTGGGFPAVVSAVEKVVIEKGVAIAIQSIETAFEHLLGGNDVVADQVTEEAQPTTVADQ